MGRVINNMFNVVGINEFGGLANSKIHCWLCIKPVSTRALFCHHCGTVQPVRELDHFARLGIEKRFDVDIAQLERQYTALARTLDPARFLIRGLGERNHATKQLEALTEAYETLRDPVRRGRYWLSLNGPAQASAAQPCGLIEGLQTELQGASEPSACDRVAQKAGMAMEQGLLGFMQALRGEDWGAAQTRLNQIDGLEAILGDIHERRASLIQSPK